LELLELLEPLDLPPDFGPLPAGAVIAEYTGPDLIRLP
jgi:hypothetical protein